MSKKLPKGNMSLFDFQERYDTEDKCREYFLRLRYPTGSFVRTAEGRNAGRSRLAICFDVVLSISLDTFYSNKNYAARKI